MADVARRAFSASACQRQAVSGDSASQRGVMTAAEEVVEDGRYPVPPHPVPAVSFDLYGTVSVAELGAEERPAAQTTGVYKNVDGHRFEDGRYQEFKSRLAEFIPEKRIFTDPVRMFAYGTDASFYRLNPKAVVKVHSEEEVAKILPIADALGVPVTFRAAGTSLSGQAVTDSVLLKLSHTGRNFRRHKVHGDGSTITVEPGLIGGEVNRILASYKNKNDLPIQYKIGPDPSSIDSCMVGGIVANNSSGMCCGVAQNTYHTLKDMRVTFVDGTTLDTSDPASRKAFLESHKSLVAGIVRLAQKVQGDRDLAVLIRKKFAIKCTTGYSLNALVDFPVSDPIEIVKRLLIGSEGTFGFISEVTYNTVPEWPNKASAFIVFPHVRDACRAASILRDNTTVDAVEMFDRACLRECEGHEKMVKLVPCVKGSDEMAAALLIECRGQTPEALESRIQEVTLALEKSGDLAFGAQASDPKKVRDFEFSHDPEVYNVYWDVRKGLIPMVGGARETGTSMLIEDVACPVSNLADMTIDLQAMFKKHGYTDASCFGHALEGNLHLVFSQGFRDRDEVQRFSELMSDMGYIVATKHQGSLKGEHGTGRNMAPFVEMEWGSKAYEIMWELKKLFDPNFTLNPGVLLNDDTAAHIKFLKPSPPASPIVDKCIECGFCESNCPSRDLTLTPRQRITVYREMSRLRALPNRSQQEEQRLKEFGDLYEYLGLDTCAADGMCQEKCPVKINTGELVKSLRAEELKAAKNTQSVSMMVARNFSKFQTAVPYLLDTVNFVHRVLGPKPLAGVSSWLNRVTDHAIPAWNPYMPRGAAKLQEPRTVPKATEQRGIPRRVVYVPSCVTRMMGPSISDYETESVHQRLMSLFHKAHYEVIYPKGISNMCCGSMFNSRGLKAASKSKLAELETALMEASEGGMIPIVTDTSPCLIEMKNGLTSRALTMSMYEPVEFINRFLQDKLEFKKVRDQVAIHVPCSSKKMGVERTFAELAGKCAHEVISTGVPCCGMAGDKGMRFPELTDSALQHLDLPASCKDGYSTSRTCEINLSHHSGIDFRGLVYLVDEATVAKQ